MFGIKAPSGYEISTAPPLPNPNKSKPDVALPSKPSRTDPPFLPDCMRTLSRVPYRQSEVIRHEENGAASYCAQDSSTNASLAARPMRKVGGWNEFFEDI
jgi:hypothetical protein